MKKLLVCSCFVATLMMFAVAQVGAQAGGLKPGNITPLNFCGNAKIDAGEKCDPALDYRQWPCNMPPLSVPTPDWIPPYTVCDATECTCSNPPMPAVCGDGFINGDEECSNSGTADNVELTEIMSPTGGYKFCPTGYVCEDCLCGMKFPFVDRVPFRPGPFTRPPCGNGVWDWATIQEQCDKSVPQQNDWKYECLDSRPEIMDLRDCINCACVGCGDGIVQGLDGEQCEITPNAKTCAQSGFPNSNCVACKCAPRQVGPICGDGIVNGNEECEAAEDCPDQPNQAQKWCRSDCTCRYRLIGETYCGDGIVNGTETCETNLDPSQWLCPPPETGGTVAEYYYCGSDCQCYPRDKSTTCHDGTFIFQPDVSQPHFEECDSDGTVADGTWSTPAEEQASADEKCEEGEICLYNCSCWKPNPDIPGDTAPEPVIPAPQVARSCSVKISGSSSKDMSDILARLNKRAHEILGTDTIDVFGEVGYSVAFVNIAFPDTAAEETVQLSSDIKVVSADNAKLGALALVQTGGTPTYDYREAYFKPTLAAIKTPTILFPVSPTSLGEAKAETLGITTPIYPNLSMAAGLGGVTLTDVVSVLGVDGVNFETATPTSMKLNNFIRLDVRPAVSMTKSTTGIGATVWEVEFREPWDWPSWTGVEGFKFPERLEDTFIENRQMDVEAVLVELEKRAAQWKAAGRPIDCDIAVGLPYEANLNMQFMAVQDKVVNGGGVDSQGFAAVALLGEVAQGAGGGCNANCSIGGAVPAPGGLILLVGAALAGIGSILAVRRSRRR